MNRRLYDVLQNLDYGDYNLQAYGFALAMINILNLIPVMFLTIFGAIGGTTPTGETYALPILFIIAIPFFLISIISVVIAIWYGVSKFMYEVYPKIRADLIVAIERTDKDGSK